MKYRQWFFVALSPLLLIVALVGVRSFGGSGGVASAHTSTGSVHVEIDMVKDGGTWCNPVDTENPVDHAGGVPYQVAICLSDATLMASDFNVILTYDPGLNTCSSTGQTGAALDANPDFISNVGTGWNCSGGGIDMPKCGETAGEAYITCGTVDDLPTIPANSSIPIAAVTFTALGYEGADNLDFGTTAFYGSLGNILRCPGDNCYGATDNKSGGTQPTPTDTPPPTATPTATSTPSCGGLRQTPCPTSTATPRAWTKTPTPEPTGTPTPTEPAPPPPPPPPPPPSGGTMPQVVPPGTGTGSGSVDWTISLMWMLASAGAFSVFLGGLCLRRARNR